jgi:hypothetical protein
MFKLSIAKNVETKKNLGFYCRKSKSKIKKSCESEKKSEMLKNETKEQVS